MRHLINLILLEGMTRMDAESAAEYFQATGRFSRF